MHLPSGGVPKTGVAYDSGPPSKVALQWAAWFARSEGRRLRLVRVVEPSPPGWVRHRSC